MMLTKKKIEEIETELFLEALVMAYGYDFKNYAKASLKRRMKHRMAEENIDSISEMTRLLLHDNDFINRFLVDMSITVTEMFRDPKFYQSFRENVVPKLKTYPFLKIWHAGCATGQEVYSMAILLAEEGLLDKTQIYATDFNRNSLSIAKEGIYPLDDMKSYTANYMKAGGTASFSDYIHSKYNSVKMDKSVMKNITFAHHNLVADGVFGEMNVVVCRNVLIYFDRDLQNIALEKFCESLCHRGFLCLGTKETIDYSSVKDKFNDISHREKIYQRTQ